jgi:hypothetical protein
VSISTTNGNGKGQGEVALQRIGFDGSRLLRLANRVANDAVEGRVFGIAPIPHLGDKREDLVMAMVERGLKAALRYDPALTNGNGNQHAQSFLAKHMEHAAGDFFRRKSEGFGDARHGHNNRIVLSPMDDDADPDVDFEDSVSEVRLLRWQRAARSCGYDFKDFVCFVLDDAADQVEARAA